MKNFADRLTANIQNNKSCIVAGFDPQLSEIPKFITDKGELGRCLTLFYTLAVEAISGGVAAVKINTAFFEQFGIEGLDAMQQIATASKNAGLLLIADAKRGDIGSTAKAYSAAFLGRTEAFGKNFSLLDADAVTVNPYLGFDTLEPFLNDCKAYGKGLFVLVKTSNPGSSALQDLATSGGKTPSQLVAEWVDARKADFLGASGYSSIGAVVGATYPEEARELRRRMPCSYFLVPGYGAQGGSAKDAAAGFAAARQGHELRGGAIINISRGLFSKLEGADDAQSLKKIIRERLAAFNSDINSNLSDDGSLT